jgi:hypothetical protein
VCVFLFIYLGREREDKTRQDKTMGDEGEEGEGGIE